MLDPNSKRPLRSCRGGDFQAARLLALASDHEPSQRIGRKSTAVTCGAVRAGLGAEQSGLRIDGIDQQLAILLVSGIRRHRVRP